MRLYRNRLRVSTEDQVEWLGSRRLVYLQVIGVRQRLNIQVQIQLVFFDVVWEVLGDFLNKPYRLPISLRMIGGSEVVFEP